MMLGKSCEKQKHKQPTLNDQALMQGAGPSLRAAFTCGTENATLNPCYGTNYAAEKASTMTENLDRLEVLRRSMLPRQDGFDHRGFGFGAERDLAVFALDVII